MAEESHEELLKEVLDRVIKNNYQARPGTPMAELKDAIEAAITALPALEFEEYSKADADKDADRDLVARAPEMIGWDADHIIEWVEELSKKL